MREVKVWRVKFTSLVRVRAETKAEAIDKAHIMAGQALKQACYITPSLADDVDIENIDMVDAMLFGTEEVPRLLAA